MSKKADKKKEKEKTKNGKMPRKEFDKELKRLQTELCHLQEHVKREGLRIIVVFEGRDAAGKGGVIKRITERVSPRVFRVVALPAPSDRQKTQLYGQRYLEHFPAAGEIILFDRSWYNRAGVERVMGFCSDTEYEDFLHVTPMFERQAIKEGIIIIKYFFDVSQEEQERRFLARVETPMKHWKLSPMDVESWKRFYEYTVAYQRMLEVTDIPESPWYRVQADDKRRARLNCISHLLSLIPYEEHRFVRPKAGKRPKRPDGVPEQLDFKHEVPSIY